MTLCSCPRCGTYTTAPTHCGRPVTTPALCACGCRAMAHAYRAATRTNDGRCLALDCGCAAYDESGQDALEIRDLSTGAWDNVASPQGALTPAGSDPSSILETNGG